MDTSKKDLKFHNVKDFDSNTSNVSSCQTISNARSFNFGRCFVPNMSPFWVSMVDRDWSQGKYNFCRLNGMNQTEISFA